MKPELFDRVQVLVGDITTLEVDAIVNAANEELARGGGVCGAIHRAAGPELEQECERLGPCPTGQARLTQGNRLPAKWVIPAVGPMWGGGGYDEAKHLAGCYRSTLELAAAQGLRTVAMPCISTGIYGYPREPACAIAVKTTLAWLGEHELPERVLFCCFDGRDEQLYRDYLAKVRQAL